MKKWKSLSGTTALFLVLSGAAQAQVTAAEVWENWKSVAEGMGQILTPGSQTQNGGTLTIRDLAVSMDVPEMSMSGTIGMIEFRDQPGGTVAITMSPTYDFQMAASPPDGEKVDLTLQISQPDLKITASGGQGTVNYDITAPSVSVTVPSLIVDGKPVEMDFDLTASDVTGNYQMTEGAMTDIVSKLNAAMVTVKVDVSKPGGGGNFAADASFADLAITSDGTMTMMGGMDDMAAMLASGFATSGSFAHGAATYAVDFQDGADNFKLNGTSDSGMLALELDADAISYETGNTGLSFTLSGSDIPLPEIAASFNEIGMSFLMPLAESDVPQDFGASLVLDGLSVSDMIWGIADPTGALPHDPASFIVNITGKGNWLVDIMNPEATAELEDEMPAELHSLDLNELRVAVAGAELTGTGGFTFDNNNLETFGGMPAPDGVVDLMLVGGNGLLDRLVAMGLIPEDQAMGARMMMGLFARPGGGEDTLTSKIEVKPDGSISANGQRLQ